MSSFVNVYQVMSKIHKVNAIKYQILSAHQRQLYQLSHLLKIPLRALEVVFGTLSTLGVSVTLHHSSLSTGSVDHVMQTKAGMVAHVSVRLDLT